MNTAKTIVLGLLLTLLSISTATATTMVTYSECQDGCPIGDQGCYSYCSSLFDPCFNQCAEQARRFIPDCIASGRQFPNDATRYSHCRDLLYIVNAQCKDNCRSIKKPVDYPGWMAEQECPYDCQRWNPASRTCVGARMNGCNL